MISLSDLIRNKYITWGEDEITYRANFYIEDRIKGHAELCLYMNYPLGKKLKKDVLNIRATAFNAYTGVYYSKDDPNHPPVFLDIDNMLLELNNITIDKIFDYTSDKYNSHGKLPMRNDVSIHKSFIKKDVMEYYKDFKPNNMTFTDCIVEE